MAQIKLDLLLNNYDKTLTQTGTLGAQMAKLMVNGANITVGNSAQVEATKDQAVLLNQALKQVIISVQRLNISLAKTARLSKEIQQQNSTKNWTDNFKGFQEVGSGKGKLWLPKNEIKDEFQEIIDASQAAINQLNNGFIPTVKSIKETAKEGAKEVATQTNRTANDTEVTWSKVWHGLQTGTKRNFNTISSLARSFFSPITIALLAFEAVIKVVTYAWNNLTQSIQKMTLRGQSALKAIQHTKKALEEKTKAAKELISQLDELNKVQGLSVDQQRLAQSILQKLNKDYKDLGITLDETTGKYQGLYQAQIKVDEQNRKRQASLLKKEIAAQREVVNAALAETFGRGINLDVKVNGKDFFTFAEVLGQTFGAENANILAQKWNTGDLQKQLEVIDQLIQGLSSGDSVLKNAPEARQALQTLIDYKKQLEDLNSVDTQIINANRRLADSFKEQAEAMKKTRQEIDDLNKSFEQRQRANSLAQLDPEDRANALRGEVEQLRKRDQLLQKAQEYGQNQLNQHTTEHIGDILRFEAIQSQMQKTDAQIKQNQQKIKQQKQKIAQLIEKAKQVQTIEWIGGQTALPIAEQEQKQQQYIEDAKQRAAQTKEIQAQVVQAEKELARLRQQSVALEVTYQEAKKVSNQYEQGILNLDKERQQILIQIQQREQQIAEIEKQLEDERIRAAQEEYQLQLKQKQAIDDIYKSYQKQIDAFNKSPIQIKLEDALQSAQKSKGVDLTQDEVDLIKFYVSELERLNELQQERKRRAEQQLALLKQQEAINQLYADYQRQIENYNKSQHQILIEEALLNAEKAKGAELTRDEIDQIILYATQLEKLKQLELERQQIRRQEQAIADIFTNYEQSQAEQYLKIIGKQKQSLLLEAKINAQRAKGAALTEQEIKSLESYIEVEDLINQLKETQNQLKVPGEKVITNELAQKGGYASSVVVDRSVNISQQILQVQKTQKDLISKIKDSVEKYSVIQ